MSEDTKESFTVVPLLTEEEHQRYSSLIGLLLDAESGIYSSRAGWCKSSFAQMHAGIDFASARLLDAKIMMDEMWEARKEAAKAGLASTDVTPGDVATTGTPEPGGL